MKLKYKIPLPIRADFYTNTSNYFVSDEAKARSVYNFTNRIGPLDAFPEVAFDNRMVFFGLSHFISDYLTEQVTEEDVMNSAHFMESANIFGGPLPFDKDLWMRVVREYDGFLPVKIEALTEGSTFFTSEPIIQVTAEDGFGELAAHIEAELVGAVSCASARVTLCRHWLNRLREQVELDNVGASKEDIDNIARYLIHDFGYRASSVGAEAILLGMAHLLVFHGTDTTPAAYLAHQQYANEKTGKSIIALAHRIVQGHKTEKDAFNAIHHASQSCKAVASYVSDCYNFTEALNTLVDMAKKNPYSTFVARPDSGDYVKNVLDILNKDVENLRFINGDSMNPTKVQEILETARFNGFSPTLRGIFGVGGYLRNTPNRDSLSSAYKLSCAGDRAVVKLSETRAKMSVPGPNSVIRNGYTNEPTVYFANEQNTAYHTYYDKGVFGDICIETFGSKQIRCIEDFDNWQEVVNTNPRFGGEYVLSENIKNKQEEVYNEYR